MQLGAGDEEDQAVLVGNKHQPPPPPEMEMEIGWPTEVRHVAHVTFDRFHGFRGVPEELRGEVEAARAPSAGKTVFGVSTESMQCSYDGRGNSVPTVLLHMQRRLYHLGGLTTEGIFRVAADATQEQRVRDHLNTTGVVPDDDDSGGPGGVDVHCLAGLIKAWFRELPGGLLDSLPADEVTRWCQTADEDECARLCAARLPPHKAALLDWAVGLMADVAREEKANKMGARNVAMVFAPNMTTQAAVDPLTALNDAVQLMNLLNMLIQRHLNEQAQAQAQAKQQQHLRSSTSSLLSEADDSTDDIY
ncbi:hypothetical protein U9M48_016368 [Paspalum notatum var. saurae]|uniref:Rho-GAP domain-containing protein n=1 Tax=Paspalum notatum var. saurae TaxID=547442 RepID=A0AAQ3T609_PASNO